MESIKSILKKTPLLGNLAIWIHWKLFPPINSQSYWINKIVKNSDIYVVQIGSNDGKTGDPIFKLIRKNKNWKVLFVEPVPYLFEKLKNNYPSEPRFIFENAAINDGSRQNFNAVSSVANKAIPDLPGWYDQLGSFDRDNIVKNLGGLLEPFIIELDIQGMTLNELLKKNRIDKLELLHIDTEGYDWKILSQLDLNKYNPLIILFEQIHLQNSEREDAINFLQDLYYIFQFGLDFLCIRRDRNKLPKKDLHLLLHKFPILF